MPTAALLPPMPVWSRQRRRNLPIAAASSTATSAGTGMDAALTTSMPSRRIRTRTMRIERASQSIARILLAEALIRRATSLLIARVVGRPEAGQVAIIQHLTNRTAHLQNHVDALDGVHVVGVTNGFDR